MSSSLPEMWVANHNSLEELYNPHQESSGLEIFGFALDCDGVYPSGPVCVWPQGADGVVTTITSQSFSNDEAADAYRRKLAALLDLPEEDANDTIPHDTKVKASVWDMAKGMAKGAEYLIKDGRVNADIREERLATCRACPHFIEASERCSECGCFMAAKSWLGADPKVLCPKKKWVR